MKQRSVTLTEEQVEKPSSTALEDLLDGSVLSDRRSPPGQINGVRLGTVVGFSDNGTSPLVIFPDQPGSAAVAAVPLIDMHADHIGRRVALMFEEGDPRRPLILGCLPDRGAGDKLPDDVPQVELEADGQRLVLSATRQIVLRCGHASITLTCDGKILLHGTYVSNRSSGVMRIKGGSVHIN